MQISFKQFPIPLAPSIFDASKHKQSIICRILGKFCLTRRKFCSLSKRIIQGRNLLVQRTYVVFCSLILQISLELRYLGLITRLDRMHLLKYHIFFFQSGKKHKSHELTLLFYQRNVIYSIISFHNAKETYFLGLTIDNGIFLS